MKSEFQKILESKLKPEVADEPATESVSNQESWYQEISFQKKFFFAESKRPYPSVKPQENSRRTEADSLKMKREWVAAISDSELQKAIEIFFARGARAFLSRKPSDIKRDFRKLALEYHPDRARFQEKCSSAECEEIFKNIVTSYQRLSLS